jgi:hypothetical protein
VFCAKEWPLVRAYRPSTDVDVFRTIFGTTLHLGVNAIGSTDTPQMGTAV